MSVLPSVQDRPKVIRHRFTGSQNQARSTSHPEHKTPEQPDRAPERQLPEHARADQRETPTAEPTKHQPIQVHRVILPQRAQPLNIQHQPVRAAADPIRHPHVRVAAGRIRRRPTAAEAIQLRPGQEEAAAVHPEVAEAAAVVAEGAGNLVLT